MQREVSSLLSLTREVSQDTRMDRLFFLLTSDAFLNLEHYWKYVDDFAIPTAINNNHPKSIFQHTLEILSTWTTKNVTINHRKSATLLFHFSTIPIPAPILTLSNSTLNLVCSIQLLDVSDTRQ